jgi:hypothetical protein
MSAIGCQITYVYVACRVREELQKKKSEQERQDAELAQKQAQEQEKPAAQAEQDQQTQPDENTSSQQQSLPQKQSVSSQPPVSTQPHLISSESEGENPTEGSQEQTAMPGSHNLVPPERYYGDEFPSYLEGDNSNQSSEFDNFENT